MKLPFLPLLTALFLIMFGLSKAEEAGLSACEKTGDFAAARWGEATTCNQEHAERLYGPPQLKFTFFEVKMFFFGCAVCGLFGLVLKVLV